MKGRILKMVPQDSPEGRKLNAISVLEEAKKEGFETVIVHGFKDGCIFTRVSARRSAIELLGALEAAKTEVWER
jgi:hypothetical protein